MAIIGFADEITCFGIIGWALDTDQGQDPVVLRIVVNGQEHGRVVADRERPGLSNGLPEATHDRHGFEYAFNPPLAPFRSVMVEVLPQGTGEAIPNGRKALNGTSASRTGMMPLIVTSRGRSGTTLLMRWLREHPDVVVANAYPYEVKFTSYFATVLKVLSTPKLVHTIDDPDFVEYANLHLEVGRNPWSSPMLLRELGGRRLEQLIGESVSDRFASEFRHLVSDAYRTIALSQDKPDVRFYAEKCMLDDDVRYGIRAIMGDVLEVVMVRDPRDFLCSAKGFWKQDPRAAMITLKDALPVYERLFLSKGPDTLFIRYEDLVEQPLATTEAVAAHFGIAARPHGVVDEHLFSIHATSATPAASVGRWRKDLSAAELAECLKLSATFMEMFGYRR